MKGQPQAADNIASDRQRNDEIQVLLDKARKAYDQKRFTRVYALIDAILKTSPTHRQARKLADTAHFDQGMALMNQKQYLSAIEQFKQVSDQHQSRDRAIAEARKRISQRAVGEKLKIAKQLLKEQAWRSVINISEEILAEDPQNDQAKMLFSNASYKYGKILLDNDQTSKAIEVLNRISPSYEDTGQLLSLARAGIVVLPLDWRDQERLCRLDGPAHRHQRGEQRVDRVEQQRLFLLRAQILPDIHFSGWQVLHQK